MIELHQFPYVWGINPSPFCLKVETYCRLAGIDYEVRSALPFRAPRGKLPFIVDNDTVIPDSGLIVEYLKASRGDALDGHLQPQQKARAHLVRRLCEESLYFALVYSRWVDERYWPELKKAFFSDLPPGVRQVLPSLARRGVRDALKKQGLGRHPRDEIYERGRADIEALATSLELTGYAVDDRPTSYDATLYAFLVQLLRCPMDTPLRQAAEGYPIFNRYLDAMDKALTASEGKKKA